MDDDSPTIATNSSADPATTMDMIYSDAYYPYITDLDRYLWIYCSPIIFIVGVVGNFITIPVWHRLTKRSTTNGTERSNSHYNAVVLHFIMMAVADIIFISSGIVPEWLQAMDYVDVGELHPITCKLEKFIFYTSGDIAIWIICVINVDRLFAVRFPLKQNYSCVRTCLNHPIVLSSFVCFLACAKNVHVFWTRGAVYDINNDLLSNCGRPEPFEYFENFVRPWIVFLLVSLIPSAIIILCNVGVIITLRRARKLRANLPVKNTSSTNSLMQTIFMCMGASFAFLLCISPSIVIYIGRAYWTDPDAPENNPYSYDIAKAINNQLVYVNHSINFILYCCTGNKFRKTFIAMLKCSKTKEPLYRERAPSMMSNLNYLQTPQLVNKRLSLTPRSTRSFTPNGSALDLLSGIPIRRSATFSVGEGNSCPLIPKSPSAASHAHA